MRPTFCSSRLRPTFRSSKPSSDRLQKSSALQRALFLNKHPSLESQASELGEKQLSSHDFKSILRIYVHVLIFSVAELLASLQPCLPHMIAIVRMLSASRYMFGICTVEGAPHARPGLPRWCGAPWTRVVCAYFFWQKQGQTATRQAAYLRSQRLVAFASLSTSRVLLI